MYTSANDRTIVTFHRFDGPCLHSCRIPGGKPSTPTHSPSSDFPQVFRGNFQEVSYRFSKKAKKEEEEQNRTIPVSFCWYFTIPGSTGALGQEFCPAQGSLSEVLPAINRVDEGSVLFSSSCPRGVVPCSIKKYELSDFCTQNASEAGFLPRINPREITEAGGTYGILELLKSEKSPELMKVVLDWCVWGQVTGGSADTMGWGKSWGSSLHSSLRCPESPAPSPASQQPPSSLLCQ